MVLDFGDIKDVLMSLHDKFDHGLILEYNDPFVNAMAIMDEHCRQECGLEKLILMSTAPTAENLAAYCFGHIQSALQRHYSDLFIKLEAVVFFETPTSSATVYSSNSIFREAESKLGV